MTRIPNYTQIRHRYPTFLARLQIYIQELEAACDDTDIIDPTIVPAIDKEIDDFWDDFIGEPKQEPLP